jgi:hypothetical protein
VRWRGGGVSAEDAVFLRCLEAYQAEKHTRATAPEEPSQLRGCEASGACPRSVSSALLPFAAISDHCALSVVVEAADKPSPEAELLIWDV